MTNETKVRGIQTRFMTKICQHAATLENDIEVIPNTGGDRRWPGTLPGWIDLVTIENGVKWLGSPKRQANDIDTIKIGQYALGCTAPKAGMLSIGVADRLLRMKMFAAVRPIYSFRHEPPYGKTLRYEIYLYTLARISHLKPAVPVKFEDYLENIHDDFKDSDVGAAWSGKSQMLSITHAPGENNERLISVSMAPRVSEVTNYGGGGLVLPTIRPTSCNTSEELAVKLDLGTDRLHSVANDIKKLRWQVEIDLAARDAIIWALRNPEDAARLPEGAHGCLKALLLGYEKGDFPYSTVETYLTTLKKAGIVPYFQSQPPFHSEP